MLPTGATAPKGFLFEHWHGKSEEAHQLDGVAHLEDMHDARIVPAASECIAETSCGHKVGYSPDQSLEQNRESLQKMEEWWKHEGARLKWNAAHGRFQ